MFQIDQCADVFVDGCVRNEASQLMFLSLFGRDTATKELLARIQLGKNQDGLQELRLKGLGDQAGQTHTIYVGDPNRLEKYTGRLPKGNLFGNLTHMWIFDPIIQAPDKGAQQAWLVERISADKTAHELHMRARAWDAVCHLSSVPLLPHWREAVLEAIWPTMVCEFGKSGTGDYNPRFSEPLGGMSAVRVRLTEQFEATISSLIRDGTLTLEPPTEPLKLAANA